ncbi:MAG TPA: signal peptidase I [Polyangiaceae bacterium]|nr:signal peptidase I [Polyangiaceae bacterium]
MRRIFEIVFWTALVLGVVIGLARAVAIRWWRVPNDDPYLSASTSPSIRAGDLILLWRLTPPGFGDLVLCPEPKRPERIVIGRIVGESRDDLEINGADITVNRKRQLVESNCHHPRTFVEHDPSSGIEVEQHCSFEELANTTHMRGELLTRGVRPPDVKTTVPDGYVFLVSDNRQYPYDSRDFGPVPRETCTETVFFRLVGAGGFFDSKSRNTYIR